ncbi:MFS transporter, partial [Candidatus Woesearchaeota archaeon]|nr:MFS transporter [Candidatus Woesearchaeota archaeon]
VYNMVYAGFAIPAGKLSDRFSRKNVLSAGYFLFGLVALSFALWANSLSVWFLFGLYGLFMAVTDGVSRAYVSDIVKAENRGFALGAYHSIVGIIVLPANLIGGFLWKTINAEAAFIYAAALSFISAVLLFTLVRKK